MRTTRPDSSAPALDDRPAARPGCLLRRRGFLAAASALTMLGVSRPSVTHTISDAARQWDSFRNRFMTPDGRIVDTGNNGVSHSEGQGMGMLAAVHSDDRAAFNVMRDWTRATLTRPFDALHPWRYRPDAARPVDDINNATDGDLLIALALFRAASRWGDRDCQQDAMAISQDVLRKLVCETSSGLVLLPGAAGFQHGADVIINPSYYIFPALQRMAEELPDPTWNRVLRDGQRLLRDARFGRWALSPDWLRVMPGKSAEPAYGWPARYSFDAVRVPLYMTWAGMAADPVVSAVVNFWGDHEDGAMPAWADLTDDAVAPYSETSGMRAIRRYVCGVRDRFPVALPSVADATDYYAASLTLLTHIAFENPVVIAS